MILVDTSVWIDHLRDCLPQLAELLKNEGVVMHPWVIGELACGNLSKRQQLLRNWNALPTVVILQQDEILAFIEAHSLAGRGIGYVDAHLLGSAAVSMTELWSRDRRLALIAEDLGLAFKETG